MPPPTLPKPKLQRGFDEITKEETIFSQLNELLRGRGVALHVAEHRPAGGLRGVAEPGEAHARVLVGKFLGKSSTTLSISYKGQSDFQLV